MSLLYNIKFFYFLFIKIIIELFKNVFGLKRRYKCKTRLDGKVVVITGANTGIGKETAYQLSKLGAKIIIGCRDLKRAENAVNDIKAKNSKANISFLKLDLSSLTSVRQFAQSVAQTVSQIDILINNAGVMACPEWTTEDGFEMQFGTNHLGHFLLTLSLLRLMEKSSNARIINVSSIAHLMGKIHFQNINLRNGAYTPMKAYSQSKLANVLFTRELSRRLGPKCNVKVYCLHPGLIDTELTRHNPTSYFQQMFHKLFVIDVKSGAQTTLYCAVEPRLENESGFYYDDCKRVHKMVRKARDDKNAQKLWEMSCDLVKLEDKLRLD